MKNAKNNKFTVVFIKSGQNLGEAVAANTPTEIGVGIPQFEAVRIAKKSVDRISISGFLLRKNGEDVYII